MSASRFPTSLPLLVALGVAAPAWPETLKEALGWAYEASPELRSEQAHLKSVDEGVAQSLAASRPLVQGFASVDQVHESATLRGVATAPVPSENGSSAISLPSSSYGLTMTLPLYRGGRTLAEFREARLLVTAERHRMGGLEEQVLFRATQAFADLRLAEERFALAERRTAALGKEMEGEAARYKAGALVRTEMLAVGAELEQSKSDLEDRRAQLDAARGEYERYVGRPSGTLSDEDSLGLSLPATLEAAEDEAVTSNPDILSAESVIDAAEQHVKDARGALLPTLSAQAVAERERDEQFKGSDDKVEALVLQLRVPIYSGGLGSSRVRAARDQLEQQNWELVRVRADVKSAAEKGFADLTASNAKIRHLDEEITQDRLQIAGTRMQVEGGEGTPKDIFQVELTLYEAESARLVAAHDQLVAQANLAVALGILTASKLSLDVSSYNPERHYRHVKYGPGL